MIAHLTGVIRYCGTTQVVVDVHGVGYLLATQNPHDYAIGVDASFHTYLAVRENALDLYGFRTREELRMFELLMTIPKIGPKSAMQIMAAADIALLKGAVAKNDPVYLTKMSGIGKKTAEKIVTELRDKFEDIADSDFREMLEADDADLIDALIALGYTQKDAREALQKLPEGLTNTNSRIKAALKLLGK